MTEVRQEALWVTDMATILDPTGLHARPAVKLTKRAKGFAARVEIRAQGQESWVNAKSPNAVMKLKAAANEPLHIRASGEDAALAVRALVDLVNRDFND